MMQQQQVKPSQLGRVVNNLSGRENTLRQFFAQNLFLNLGSKETAAATAAELPQHANVIIGKPGSEKKAAVINDAAKGLEIFRIKPPLLTPGTFNFNAQPALNALLEQLNQGKVVIAHLDAQELTFHDAVAIFYLIAAYPHKFIVLRTDNMPTVKIPVKGVSLPGSFKGDRSEIANIAKIAMQEFPYLAIAPGGVIYAAHSNIPALSAEGATLQDFLQFTPPAPDERPLKSRYTALGLNKWFDITRPEEVDSLDEEATVTSASHSRADGNPAEEDAVETTVTSTASAEPEAQTAADENIAPPPPPSLEGLETFRSAQQHTVKQPVTAAHANGARHAAGGSTNPVALMALAMQSRQARSDTEPKAPSRIKPASPGTAYTGRTWSIPTTAASKPAPKQQLSQQGGGVDRSSVTPAAIRAAAAAALAGNGTPTRPASRPAANGTRVAVAPALAAQLSGVLSGGRRLPPQARLQEKRRETFTKLMEIASLYMQITGDTGAEETSLAKQLRNITQQYQDQALGTDRVLDNTGDAHQLSQAQRAQSQTLFQAEPFNNLIERNVKPILRQMYDNLDAHNTHERYANLVDLLKKIDPEISDAPQTAPASQTP